MAELINLDEVFVAIFSEDSFEHLARLPSEELARAFIHGVQAGAQLFSGTVHAYILDAEQTKLIAERGSAQADVVYQALAKMRSQQ